MALPTTQQQKDIAGIYAAFWGRAPDPEGFGYWCDLYANGMALDTIADAFRDLPEGQAAYPIYMTQQQFIGQVYEFVFGRPQDAAGATYWNGIMTNGGYSEGEMVTLMVNSATAQAAAGNTDGLLFQNKVIVGNWTVQNVLNGNVTPEQEAVITTNAFRYVTADPSSIAYSQTYISHLPTGTPYNLTINQDVWTGVAGNDLFVSNLAGAAGVSNTLTLGDTLNGGDGYDILDANVGQSIGAGTFTLRNVEEVQFAAFGGDIAITNSFNGVNLVQYDNTDSNNLTLNGLTGSVDVSLLSLTGGADLTINAGDTAASQTVTLDGVANTTLTINESAEGTTPVVNVVAQGNASSQIEFAGHGLVDANTLNIAANANLSFDGLTMADLTNLTIAGAGDVSIIDVAGNATVTLGLNAASLITVNAVAATGDVDVEIANTGGASLAANFGSGDDVLDIRANTSSTATVAASMGLGNDDLIVNYTLPGQTNVTLVGGQGSDALIIEGVQTGAQLDTVDFNLGSVTGFESLVFDSQNISLQTAASLTLSGTDFTMIDFDLATLTYGTSAGLNLIGLANNAEVAFGTVVSTGSSAAEFDLSIDGNGALTLSFDHDSAFVAGVSAAENMTFANADSLEFDLGLAANDADVTLAFTGGSLYADEVTTISVTGGSTGSYFSLDLQGLSTTTSDLTALTTVDISHFEGTVSIAFGTSAVFENNIDWILNDGIAGQTTAVVATLTGTGFSDEYIFASALNGDVTITNFNNNNGAANSDYLNVSAFGIRSMGDMTIVNTDATHKVITSTYFAGSIHVTELNGGNLTASDFIFA